MILIVGGLFLLFKGTMELHERLEGAHGHKGGKIVHAVFWQVIVQIVVLDAVFSLDSVITAVGMVDNLWVMITAVCIAMAVMIVASKPLMAFVSKHPTVVILCLGFLLMIGFSLVVEGFGQHIPKGYLYAAIGFSVLIEAFNQIGRRNREQLVVAGNLRQRTSETVLRLLGGKVGEQPLGETVDVIAERAGHGRAVQARGAGHDPRRAGAGPAAGQLDHDAVQRTGMAGSRRAGGGAARGDPPADPRPGRAGARQRRRVRRRGP